MLKPIFTALFERLGFYFDIEARNRLESGINGIEVFDVPKGNREVKPYGLIKIIVGRHSYSVIVLGLNSQALMYQFHGFDGHFIGIGLKVS